MDDLMNQGRRDLVCGEYSKAVECFQNVCGTLSKEHGEIADVLGDPYFYYGSALLEMARIESGVLGNALDGVPEEDDEKDDGDLIEKNDSLTEEEKEKLSNEVIDAMCQKEENECENGESDVKKSEKDDATPKGNEIEASTKDDDSKSSKDNIDNSEKSVEMVENKETCEVKEVNDEDKDEGNSEEKDEGNDAEKDEANGEEKDENAEDDDAEKDDDEESEDVGNLQLAWEVIELSKQIFARRGEEKEHQLRVADCLFKLGEIGLEKEDYTQAISDMKESLSLRKRLLGEDDRSLAEAYYQLALAYSADDKFDESVLEFKNCELSLKRRLEILDRKMSEDIESSLLEEIKNEHKDISELLPSVHERILEAEEEKVDHDHIKKVVREGFMNIIASADKKSESTFSSTTETAAEDISHLIRKKRKADDSTAAADGTHTTGTNGNNDSVEPEVPVKKVKTADDLHMNGDSNGCKTDEIKTKSVQNVTAGGDTAPMEES